MSADPKPDVTLADYERAKAQPTPPSAGASTCPVCGAPVTPYSTGEGTHSVSYTPPSADAPDDAVEALVGVLMPSREHHENCATREDRACDCWWKRERPFLTTRAMQIIKGLRESGFDVAPLKLRLCVGRSHQPDCSHRSTSESSVADAIWDHVVDIWNAHDEKTAAAHGPHQCDRSCAPDIAARLRPPLPLPVLSAAGAPTDDDEYAEYRETERYDR